MCLPGPPYDIRGKGLRLRALHEADADGPYLRWINDPEVVRYTESRFARHSAEELRAYIAAANASDDALLLAIETLPEGRHIGNIKLGAINWIHRTADIGLIIGDRACWGRGYGSAAIACLAVYAFDRLGLEKLSAGIYAPNEGCIRAFAKAGFVEEGVLRSQCRFEAGRVDVVLMGRIR